MYRRTNKFGKFEVKKVKNKGAVSKMSFVSRSLHAPLNQRTSLTSDVLSSQTTIGHPLLTSFIDIANSQLSLDRAHAHNVQPTWTIKKRKKKKKRNKRKKEKTTWSEIHSIFWISTPPPSSKKKIREICRLGWLHVSDHYPSLADLFILLPSYALNPVRHIHNAHQ